MEGAFSSWKVQVLPGTTVRHKEAALQHRLALRELFGTLCFCYPLWQMRADSIPFPAYGLKTGACCEIKSMAAMQWGICPASCATPQHS